MNPAVLLGLFILLRGSEGNVLKLLQSHGGDSISFCNVFFFSSLITGVVMLLVDRSKVQQRMPQLLPSERLLLLGQGFFGYFLGPVGFFLALERLSVVAQTLLFSLTVPLSTIAAGVLLKERLPKVFPITLTMICAGVVLGSSRDGVMAMLTPHNQWIGVVWGSIGVIAFALGGVLNRLCSSRDMSVGLTVGVGSTASAVVFAVIALIVYGPDHFIALQLWWVLGVIGLYGLTISLGGQWTLLASYQKLEAAQISLWSSATLVVALAGAHLLLAEPLGAKAIVGAGLILMALLLHQSQRA